MTCLEPGSRDVGAFSKVGPRLVYLRFGVFALKIRQSKSLIFRHRLDLDETLTGNSVRYGVASGVGWKDTTVVVRAPSL